MSTLEQLPIKKGRSRKVETIPEQPGILAALESVKEAKKRITKKKATEALAEEAPVKVLTKERKKRLAKEAISERVEKKRKLKKSIESKQEDAPLENEEAFRGEGGSTIFTGPENLSIEGVSTTESVDYQPSIDDMSFDDIIGRNVQTEEEVAPEIYQEQNPEYDEASEEVYESPQEQYRPLKNHPDHAYNIDSDDLTPEELYAPLLPKDTARDDIKLNQSEYYDKPGQSFNDKPTSVIKRFWNWVSRKNPDMYAAHKYYDFDRQEEAAKHNKNKKEAWFKEFNQSKGSKNIDREAINKFVDSQNRNAVARDIEDYNEIEDHIKEEAQFDHALNEFKDHLDEEERLYDARVAEQALEEKKMLEAWGPYLKERKIESEIDQTISDLEARDFHTNNGASYKNERKYELLSDNPEYEKMLDDFDAEIYPEELTGRTEHQEELAIKLDNKAHADLKGKKKNPRGNIKGFTSERYYN